MLWYIFCLQNVSVNDEILNLSVTGQSTLLPGCRSHDLCHDNRCQNGGSCQDLWTTSYCECTPGYIGDEVYLVLYNFVPIELL
jgi:hypothetical protein